MFYSETSRVAQMSARNRISEHMTILKTRKMCNTT